MYCVNVLIAHTVETLMLSREEFDRVRTHARRHPDPESWSVGDPDSYALALRGGLIGDPHVTPHMGDRSRITEFGIRSAASYYGSHTEWREKDPITYWRASDLSLLEAPHIVGHMRTKAPAMSFPEVRRRARLHPTLADWAAADPSGHKRAVRSGWVRLRELVGHFPDAGVTPPFVDLLREAVRYRDLNAWESASPDLVRVARRSDLLSRRELTGHMGPDAPEPDPVICALIGEPGRLLLSETEIGRGGEQAVSFAKRLRRTGALTPIGGGFLLICASLPGRGPEERERALIGEVARLTRSRIVPGPAAEARRLGLPEPAGSWPDYETDGATLDLSLDEVRIRLRPAKAPWRLYAPDRKSGSVLRGLCALTMGEIEDHADRVISGLAQSDRKELRRHLEALPPALRARLELALARTGRGGQ